ncbi:MAG: CoA ester lyase [Ahrensia sp.]|nr:CoA ester lyase [Ahrensia sp.]
MNINSRLLKLRRSMLYVPADNKRAMEKCMVLDADCVIFDLEDAVAPQNKEIARENLRDYFSAHPTAHFERAIRINPLKSEWGTEDFMCARACMPSAIVLPKVSKAADVRQLNDALDQSDAALEMEIFAMIETASGVLNIGDIAALGQSRDTRLSTLIVGLNDLVKDTRIGGSQKDIRKTAHSWLMQIVLGARAGSLDIIDAVYNDIRDVAGFSAECLVGAQMGFDGKTLIHPVQIEAANHAFMPSESDLIKAGKIVRAFGEPQNASIGVLALDGEMIERLHFEQAEQLLAKAAMIEARKRS